MRPLWPMLYTNYSRNLQLKPNKLTCFNNPSEGQRVSLILWDVKYRMKDIYNTGPRAECYKNYGCNSAA